MVRVILAETTLPVRMRPRIETSPVKGHFLSMYVPLMASLGVYEDAEQTHMSLTACEQHRAQNAP